MPATGSTRTATRWWFCSVLLLVAALAACTTSTTYYVPSAGDPRYGPDGARDELDRLLTLECPRLLAAGREISNPAKVLLDVAANGEVTRSHVAHSSGDDKVDTMIGAVTARLKFDPLATGATGTGELNVGYACSAGGGAVTTLEVK